jgi:hypothetical protein
LVCRDGRLDGLGVSVAGRHGTATSHSAQGEHNNRGQDAEDDNDDQKFNQREPTVSIASGLLALDFLKPLHHFFLPFVMGLAGTR